MTLDNFVEADILATCNALGSDFEGDYEKGTDCIECLKDILRYLKRDTETHSILRYLGSIRLLQTDLLPIIKKYDKDTDIFDFTLRILVALTNPALLLFKEDLPDDKISRNLYLQVISYLQSYKKAIVDVNVWKVFFEHLKDLLKIRPVERSSEENLLIERMVILVRNVLHIPPDESILKQTTDDLSLHDRVLWSLHESKMDILLLYMCANEEEHQYCLHILEIIYLMLRDHTSETLASSNETRTDSDKQKDLDILLAARKREENLKMQKIQAVSKSRFNGVYCIKNMKSLSEKDYIAHKLITNADDVKFDLPKSARCKPKNRVRAADVDNTRQSTISIRLFLKNFCKEFLKAYNKLMVSVKRELIRKLNDEHDETYYLWAICFFMQFNRLYDFQAALVSETISTQTFHHIQTEIINYYEMMLTDKKKTVFWAKRMQLGVSAYKELLETLRKMERSEHKNVKNSADTLVSHVFYVIEYREMLISLLSSYDEVKFPLSYLAELVESTQLFLKMLENHSKKHSEIIVQQKKRKVYRKKKKNPVVTNEPVNEENLLSEQWDAVSSELSNSVLGRRPIPKVTPFDCASDLSFEEQKVEAVYQIRDALIANEACKAVGLLRAARELWPDGDSFGAIDIDCEPEFMVLREIHFSNLKKDPVVNTNLETEDISNEEDEEMESMPAVAEQQLDLNDVYKKYASPKVVHPCSLLLANYRKNKPQTNTCLVKLLHRIAWNCKMHALFFQSTIFLTFQKIFHDPDAKSDPIIKEFYRFAKFIMQKFFVTVEKNNKVFIEFLFWKGAREAFELEEGYGASENKTKGWTDEDEEELKYLFEENKDIYIEGQDVADIILANFNKTSRTKKQIISALKRLGLIKSAKELKPEKRKEWVESEILDLQHLFEDYKDTDNVMVNILERLSIKRSRKAVVDKLLELNLIQDRKEVRKKGSKAKKSQMGDSDGDTSDENDETYDNNCDENGEGERAQNNSGSSDEDERNFFQNLEAERTAGNNCLLNETTSKDIADLDTISDKHAKHKKKETNSQNISEKIKGKVSKAWLEQDILELTSLFHENQSSDEIMNVLLGSLSVKRPKQAIVEKLLELGLIKDKEEILKKKKTKLTKENTLDESDLKKSLLSDSGNNFSDIEKDEELNVPKEKKRSKRRILSDSSDEDIPLSRNPKESDISKKADKPKKKKPIVWEEMEIIELTRLFLENKESDDVMAGILKGLTVKRTQKDIKEKLLEIQLIKDKNMLKKKVSANRESGNKAKPKRKKPTDLWEEQEIAEVSKLFQESKDSSDIMDYILKGLSIKRSKQNVLEKLLEMGLISDKKEVRKKRESKNLKSKILKDSDVSDKEAKNEKRRSQTRKNNKSILSESSDDEDLALDQLISSANKDNDIVLDTSMGIKRKKKRQSVLSESSDDENMCINNIISSAAAQDIHLFEDNSVLNGVPLQLDKSVALKAQGIQNFLESSSFKNMVESDLSSKDSGKRKRFIVSSDDSGDDNSVLTGETSKVKTDFTSDIPESDKQTVLKMKKKKIRVLDDSDDSS